jgi:hypothetical protein
MSDDKESYEEYSVDDETQLQPGDTLDNRGIEDVLDEGYSPPEKPRGVNKWGTTLEEQHLGEPLSMRLPQEEPDPGQQLGDPLLDEDGDEEVEEDEAPDLREVGNRRAGRLVEPDEGSHEDDDPELFSRDVGIDGGGSSAEEAAMHIIDPADSDND